MRDAPHEIDADIQVALPNAAALAGRFFSQDRRAENPSGARFLLPECHIRTAEAEFPHHIELKKPDVD
ncbi:hypothetical protein [Mesorhizobium hawassense]|uniref:hypothetical protein n=1 Tax=Mesorhizobium hawassense TaxID=1209954 RepID=UPI0011BE5307|nr:hypothetical protein [Mesorhizobium hawassense]